MKNKKEKPIKFNPKDEAFVRGLHESGQRLAKMFGWPPQLTVHLRGSMSGDQLRRWLDQEQSKRAKTV